MRYLGDFADDQTVEFAFNTHVAGVPTTLGGTPVLKVFKGNATGTEVTTGITLSVDHDSRTGDNHVTIVTTDAFYATANDYTVKITTGTVGGNSVVGVNLAQFSIESRNIKADLVKVNGVAATIYDGVAQAGSSTTITLAAGDTGVANCYAGQTIKIVGGTGIGQAQPCVAYNSTTKVATVPGWGTAPDSTSQYSFGNSYLLTDLDGRATVDAFKVKFGVSGGTLTVYRADGSTTSYTKTLTSDAAAEPIIGNS